MHRGGERLRGSTLLLLLVAVAFPVISLACSNTKLCQGDVVLTNSGLGGCTHIQGDLTIASNAR